MPRCSKSDDNRQQSARGEAANTSTTMSSRLLRSGSSAGTLESLPTASSSFSTQQHQSCVPPPASNVNSAAVTLTHTSKRQRNSSHSNIQEQSRSKKQKSWEECSTEEDEASPASEQHQQGSRRHSNNNISTVTPSSAMLVSRVSSAVDSNTTRLALEMENATAQHSRLISHPRQRHQQSLPPGVVDLYSSPSTTTRPSCMCGEDHCSSESLTASFLSTYGQEYYDYLRDLDDGRPLSRQKINTTTTMAQHEDRDDTSSSSEGSRSTLESSSPGNTTDYPRELPALPPILGCPYEDDDLGALESRNDITPKMRAVLVDWMIEISEAFSLSPSTLQLAVALVDKSLASDNFHIQREMVQCLGWYVIRLAGCSVLFFRC
jgi:hypothetical protein